MSRPYDRNLNQPAPSKSDKPAEDRMALIDRKANKFKTLIFSKYSMLPFPALLEKARKYQKKYNLTEDEFNVFLRYAMTDKGYQSNIYGQPVTPMAKMFGYSEVTMGKMNVDPNQLDVVQEILRIQAENLVLHEQVTLQSLTFTDCAPQALTGCYDIRKQNSFSYIHPVIAALFLIKVKCLEEQMLLASIPNIVNCRYNGKPFKTQPESELFWSLIVDPNGAACGSMLESPLLDLKNRSKLQVELWKIVRELREGRYYSDEYRHFTYALDSCKTGFFDSPDMSYIRDEGTVLRKLFHAFSLRPTFVSITSLNPNMGIMAGNYSITTMGISQVVSLPIMNLRLPISQMSGSGGINLNDALQQSDWFYENKMIVPKIKSVIFSRDLIVFYANRRYQSINYTSLMAPYNFCLLPATHSALETINDTAIRFNEDILIGQDDFHLRTVVFVERAVTNPKLIVGCSTGIIVRRDLAAERHESSYFVYDPQAVSYKYKVGEGEAKHYESYQPIYEIAGTQALFSDEKTPSFYSKASRCGSIFIYVKSQSHESSGRFGSFGV